MDAVLGMLLFFVLYFLYLFGKKRNEFWAKKGVPFVKPLPFLGNSSPLIFRQKSDTDFAQYLYNQFDGRYGGIWFFTQPILMIRDPELIKAITIKDFNYFMNRNMVVNEDMDPLFAKNLLTIRDERWKNMRNILSPAFTSAKIKNMFHLVKECSVRMTEYVNQLIDEQVETNHPDGNTLHLEFKSFASFFTNDVTATTAFGVEVNSFKNPKNDFYLGAKEITDFSGKKFFIAIFRFLTPYLSKKLNLKLFPEEVSQFFRDLVIGTMKIRQEKNIIRHDMIHLLMLARNGILKENDDKEPVPELSEDDLTAQAVLFLIAGFDTTSTFLSFTAYELALNKNIQTRLRDEIDRIIEEADGLITYEGVINKMEYLNMVVNESLRKWPPLSTVDRLVSHRYVISAEKDNEAEVVLDKGDVILLPVQGLHHDPKYFPEPEKFDPERFNEENKHKIVPFSYIPFGSGPRNCIGTRFALMEGKLCLVYLLRHFTLEVIPKTDIPIKTKKGSVTKTGENGIWIGLKRRKNI